MLQNLRHEKILEQLERVHAMKITELAKQLEISESTIRRDINELDRQGKLRKVFGGAASLKAERAFRATDVAQRSQINMEAKECIARYAASLVEDDDFIYIDAGTTTYQMIDHLEKKRISFVTNAISHAAKLVQKGFDVYIIGGILRPMTEAAIGPSAIEAVNKYNFTKCFMGTNGVDFDRGFSTPDISEAAVKTAVMKRSCSSFVLADHTKFGRISSVTFAKLPEAQIITDRLDDPQYREETVINELECVNKSCAKRRIINDNEDDQKRSE